MPHTLYLTVGSNEQNNLRSELSLVLQRAGLIVTPALSLTDDDLLRKEMAAVSCSIHLLHPQYTPLNSDGDSLARWQFQLAKEIQENNSNFKIVVWLPPNVLDVADQLQQQFINEVRNSIGANTIFSNASSAIQLVDDIRSLLEVKESIDFNLSNTDIFLIANQLDEMESGEIIDMLSDIVPVEKLNIIQDSDTDYSELCRQQIPKSKLAVVYFKMSADWALPFAQQVWKKIGGAASHTPILLIGDEDPESNIGKKFVAPKVISMIVAGELIPLEIKVQYDKVIG